MFPSRQPFVKPDTSASAVRPACTLLPSHACIIINGDQSTMSMKVLVQGLYYLQWLKRLVQCGDPAEKHPENKPVCFRGTMNRHIAPPTPGLNYLNLQHTCTCRRSECNILTSSCVPPPASVITLTLLPHLTCGKTLLEREDRRWEGEICCNSTVKKVMKFVKHRASLSCVIAGNRAETIMSQQAIKQTLKGNNTEPRVIRDRTSVTNTHAYLGNK